METKIMQVFYGTDGLPYKDKELQVHYPIVGGKEFTGASNTTEIRFYLPEEWNGATWVANAILPNGSTGSKILSSNHDEDGDYYSLTLSAWFTRYKGDLLISLQGYVGGINYTYDSDTGIYTIYGTPTIQATGLVKINISYATPFSGGEEETITLQQLLALIAEIGGRSIAFVDDISTADLSNYELGAIIYDKTTKKFYTKTGTSPYYEQYDLLSNINNIVQITFPNGAYIEDDGENINFGHSGSGDINFEFNGGKLYYDNVEVATIENVANLIPIIDISTTGGTITTGLNRLAVFPSFLKDNYNDIYIHCSTDTTNYVFRKIIAQSIINNSIELVFGEVYVNVNKTSGVYTLVVNTDSWYNKSQNDALLNLKADKSNTYTKAQIDAKLTSMLVYKGTKTVSELNSLVSSLGANETGFFYNVSDNGTLTWIEGGATQTLEVLAGDNVCWTGGGWDKLTMDLSVYNETFLAAGFLQAGEIDSVPENLTFDENGDITNPNWTGEIAIDYMSPPISDISISDVPATLTFDLTQNYDNMITNADWTGIMTITY